MNTTNDIKRLLSKAETLPNGTKELLHTSFICDKEYILRPPTEPYSTNEIEWYLSQSLDTNDLALYAGFVPKIWKDISDINGKINSNYGWCCFSKENGEQFKHAIEHLKHDPYTRKAILIYNRPSMHSDWSDKRQSLTGIVNKDHWMFDTEIEYKRIRGDFMCCQNNQLFIRNNKLEMVVHMRSMDAVYGYNIDYKWFKFVFDKAYQILSKTYKDLQKGDIVIFANSIHVYDRHFNLLEGKTNG